MIYTCYQTIKHLSIIDNLIIYSYNVKKTCYISYLGAYVQLPLTVYILHIKVPNGCFDEPVNVYIGQVSTIPSNKYMHGM